MKKIQLGVSSCLLGNKVRYDGAHKKNTFVAVSLSEIADLIAFCPEAEAGLGIPRPPVRLVQDSEKIKILGVKNNSLDVSEELRSTSEEMVSRITNLDGFVLKSKSPSCGMERVKLYSLKGDPVGVSRGVFAEELIKKYPYLPVEEEGRLNDFGLRVNFLKRIFIYNQFRNLEKSKKSLLDFHAKHKYILMAHSQSGLGEMGRLLSNFKNYELDNIFLKYRDLLMLHLKRIPTVGNHVNVLQHLKGYFKKIDDDLIKNEIDLQINNYAAGKVSLSVPLCLIRLMLKKYPDEYLDQQVYISPYLEVLAFTMK